MTLKDKLEKSWICLALQGFWLVDDDEKGKVSPKTTFVLSYENSSGHHGVHKDLMLAIFLGRRHPLEPIDEP